jgi:hypothetical protein
MAEIYKSNDEFVTRRECTLSQKPMQSQIAFIEKKVDEHKKDQADINTAIFKGLNSFNLRMWAIAGGILMLIGEAIVRHI